MGEVWYLDTGVFVTPILRNRTQEVVDECLRWQHMAADGTIDARTSFLTWDELTWVAAKAGGSYDPRVAATAGRLFLDLPGLSFIAVDSEVAGRAQQILRDHRLKPRDSIHASSALVRAGGSIVTLDSDLRKVSIPGLVVEEISE